MPHQEIGVLVRAANARESTEVASITKHKASSFTDKISHDTVFQGVTAAPGIAVGCLQFVSDNTSAMPGTHLDEGPSTAARQVILIGDSISVADISRVDHSRLAGIVCLNGSKFSHTTIVAEALGIPAVVGLGAANLLAPGDALIIDGNGGRLYLNPSVELLHEYSQFFDSAAQETQELEALRHTPAVTRDGTAIELLVNTGLLADARPGLHNGAEGVGLYRSELPFLTQGGFPTEDEQYTIYREILQMYEGKPVTMRLLDIGGDKQLPYHPVNEKNPGMGLRGIRFLHEHPGILRTQLRAMLRASVGLYNLRLLLPMVSELKEITVTRQILADVVRELRQEGAPVKLPDVGMMVEVPAVVSQLELMVDDIDFLSVGSNDLTSFLLAVDRQNPFVANHYDPLHPAFIDILLQIVAKAERLRLPVTVCGEIANTDVGVVLLLSTGVRRLSIHAASIPRVKRLIRRLDLDDLAAINRQEPNGKDRSTLRARTEAYVQRRNLKTRAQAFGNFASKQGHGHRSSVRTTTKTR